MFLKFRRICCILSKFYIKPQPRQLQQAAAVVVSYRNSTSNHNLWTTKSAAEIVVSYRNSTSNHNLFPVLALRILLYLIEILHQTTTRHEGSPLGVGCILSKFYIKPQHRLQRFCSSCVVSYRNSTSNHNVRAVYDVRVSVVSYRNSTSNHNIVSTRPTWRELYLIEILHQTTTGFAFFFQFIELYLIEILHQTTTFGRALGGSAALYLIEILHQTTTETTAILKSAALYLIEILHQTTTYFEDAMEGGELYLIEILHQTTT